MRTMDSGKLVNLVVMLALASLAPACATDTETEGALPGSQEEPGGIIQTALELDAANREAFVESGASLLEIRIVCTDEEGRAVVDQVAQRDLTDPAYAPLVFRNLRAGWHCEVGAWAGQEEDDWRFTGSEETDLVEGFNRLQVVLQEDGTLVIVPVLPGVEYICNGAFCPEQPEDRRTVVLVSQEVGTLECECFLGGFLECPAETKPDGITELQFQAAEGFRGTAGCDVLFTDRLGRSQTVDVQILVDCMPVALWTPICLVESPQCSLRLENIRGEERVTAGQEVAIVADCSWPLEDGGLTVDVDLQCEGGSDPGLLDGNPPYDPVYIWRPDLDLAGTYCTLTVTGQTRPLCLRGQPGVQATMQRRIYVNHSCLSVDGEDCVPCPDPEGEDADGDAT